ncbi:hypothetical protein JVT61DRAFT_6970 [Boletus reticuloceps]|uniref:Uncharacterized protein n=1 Tax=Boletus reticuloceps TaxID=495285 RepID=A0A8I2YII9_9AGAM|nr:hypothetical protein JVT61DRAFT_6970 [Boletus reticuloceps]
MLSGESTPLLKQSIQLLDTSDKLDVDGAHKLEVLFNGIKVLQASPTSQGRTSAGTPNGRCLSVVLRTGLGTAQGQLVWIMIFSTGRVSVNNLESFLFIGSLLIFAIAASRYVWVKGITRDLKDYKLLLNCVLIITSVTPPELPMELSLTVNASLMALSKFSMSVFLNDTVDKQQTGTITAKNLVLEGVTGIDDFDKLSLINVNDSGKQTMHCLAAAHALVRLDDGVIISDPMERTTLNALELQISQGDSVAPSSSKTPNASRIYIRCCFQFSSALKRMSTVSTFPSGKVLVAVKGASETIKGMLVHVPEWYDEAFKWYTRRAAMCLPSVQKKWTQCPLTRLISSTERKSRATSYSPDSLFSIAH